MIKLYMMKGKWRMSIDNEQFEFDSMQSALDELAEVANIKDKYGRLKNFEDDN